MIEPAAPSSAIEQARRLRAAGRHGEALVAYAAAIAADPGDLVARQNQATLLAELGRFGEAEAALRAVLATAPRDPATRFSLASVLLAMGRYPEAYAHFDARFERGVAGHQLPQIDAPRWRSFHPAGRQVLVVPEQGHGDQIQFARFVPWLVEAGASVTLLAFPPLHRLFRDSFPGASVISLAGEVAFPQPDFYVMSHDLPGLAGVVPDTVPNAPYLIAPPVPTGLPEGFRVGLMTRGNPALAEDALRSLAEPQARRLRERLPGAIVDLAPEETGARDFADTAALIGGLDLVVTVDTAVAHLAGALDKRCLTLVRSFSGDWRWPRGQRTTPWYPSMTLHWASPSGEWDAAIDEVAAIVQAEAAR